MLIQSTSNYDMFKISPSNRDVKQGTVEKLKYSILKRNLLHRHPILVNKDMVVIDGQNRLQAARELNLPIYYIVDSDLQIEDMAALNDAKSIWSYDDYLKHYVNRGFEEYRKLALFLKTNKIKLQTAFVVLGLKGSGSIKDKKEAKNVFKEGKFIFPVELEGEAMEILYKSQQVIDYAFSKLEGHPGFLKGTQFRRALYIFLSIKAVEFDVFMNKLSQRLDLIRPCPRIIDFVNIFKQIYNFKNRNPVTFDEFV